MTAAYVSCHSVQLVISPFRVHGFTFTDHVKVGGVRPTPEWLDGINVSSFFYKSKDFKMECGSYRPMVLEC